MPANRLQAAALGGLFMGVLSALPMINFGNCCCLWVVGGGLIAAYLVQNSTPTAITAGDGALAGLMAGIIGAVVCTLVSIPISMITGPMMARMARRVIESTPEMSDAFRPWMGPGTGGASVLNIVAGFFIYLVIGAIFSTIGGMLGAAIFSKNKPKVIEPPPL